MAVFMGAFPVLQGKEDEARKFAQETLDRREDFEASQARLNISTEEWSLQKTPMGSFVIVRFETPDVGAALGAFGESSESFDAWFKGRVLEITGVDLSAPSNDPLPELILAWQS